MSSPSKVRGEASAENGFYCHLISVDRLCRQQVTSIFYLFVLKSGGTVPLSPKCGVSSYTPVNYAYDSVCLSAR